MSDTPLPPVIELDRVRLRPLRATDANAFLAYLQNSAVTDRTAYPTVSRSLVEGMIERYQRRWAAGELSKWGIALLDNDELVGTCGFNEWSRDHSWAELAYDLAQPHWGKGVMRQAVNAVLEWGFWQGQLNRIHAYVRVDNERSAGLLERCGFVREGCLRSFRMCRRQPYDYDVYALLRSEWVTQHPAGMDE